MKNIKKADIHKSEEALESVMCDVIKIHLNGGTQQEVNQDKSST